MKKCSVLLILSALLAVSCSFINEEIVRGNFWAKDLSTNTQSPYRISAELLVTGEYCTVWVEKGCGIYYDTAKKVADEFDENIYNKMIDNFSINITYNMISDVFGNSTGIPSNANYNTMQFADILGDEDGKLCILLLDIRDGYKEGVNESYVGGYFWAGDLIPALGSNRCDMIYIDTYPGMSTPEMVDEAFSTLAHEMQHLMNFVTSYVKRYEKKGNTTNILSMDIWINEGLSSAAEYVYKGGHVQERVSWFLENGSKSDTVNGLIDKGNNFFVWGNRSNESQYAILDDYATVYLFFQWLRLQSSETGIYKKIISSSKVDHSAVVDNISGYSSWDALLKTWLAANCINAATGPYGYNNDPVLKDIKTPAPSSLTTNISLSPGEGVYSIIGNVFSKPADGANIKYAILSDSAVVSTAANGYTLLTYNANSYFNYDNFAEGGTGKGNPESGITTGTPIAANVSLGKSNASRHSAGVTIRPFRVSAGDLLRQRTFKINPEEWNLENEE